MDSRTTVILVAEESAGAQVARMIGGDDRLGFAAVITTEGSPVARVAEGLEVAATSPDRLATGWLPPVADLLLNVHSLHLLPDAVLDRPRLGGWNLHPGALPEWAGLNTVSWAILHQAETYGVTLHRMTSTVDAGPVFARSDFEVAADDTAIRLYGRCVREGVLLVRNLLEHAIAGDPIRTVDQELEDRRWYGGGVPKDVAIDWSAPASRIAAVVRACDYGPFRSPWGSPHTTWEHRTVEVLTARAHERAVDEHPGAVVTTAGHVAFLATGRGTLEIDRVRVDGRAARAGEVLGNGAVLG